MGAPPLRALFALTPPWCRSSGEQGGLWVRTRANRRVTVALIRVMSARDFSARPISGTDRETPIGGYVNNWILNNALLVAWLTGACVVLTIVAVSLWVRATRNTRTLSRELDLADDALAERLSAAAQQATRLRIIRELHDGAVVALTQIVRQADAAGYVGNGAPGAAERSAKLIAGLARDTLAELRRIVTIASDGQSVDTAQPSIQLLAELLAERRRAGLEIIFSESGPHFEPQPGADAAIYRIVEEALSNALQFGGPGTEVRVSFVWTAEGVQVLVDDNGVQAQAQRQGLNPHEVAQQRRYTFADDLAALVETVAGGGVSEMRTRTDAFGGIFQAYPVPGVGFSVSAVFPALRYDNGVHSVNLQR